MRRGVRVTELPPTETVAVGDRAPEFTRPLVNADYWEDVALSDLAEANPVLLVHYPMDGTGTTKSTWIELRERGWGSDELTVVGVSISTPYEHSQLIDRHDLPFALFSDPAAGVAEAYGTVHDLHGMAGIRGHRPAVFLIDPDLTVRYAWVTEQWPPEIPFEAIEAAIAER